MFPKRKGGSGKRGGGRRRLLNGRRTSKEAANEVNKGYDRHTGRNTSHCGYKSGKKSTHIIDNSNGVTNGRSGTKQQKRRRKRWTGGGNGKKEKVQTPNIELNRRAQRTKGRKGGNPKRGGKKKNVVSSESGGSYSTLPMSSISQLGYSHSSSLADYGQASQVKFDHLPWANLDVPMDLSQIRLEINRCGMDFDLQARKNHQRWLTNLEKVQAGSAHG